MPGFDYDKFKAALFKAKEDSHAVLMEDIEKVKVFVEKALTLCLESNANMSRVNYPGVDA